MKICDLTQFYSPVSGGVKRYLQEKAAYMRDRRPDDRHVLVVPGQESRRIEEGNATVYTVASPLISRRSRYRALLNLSAVEEILEREKPAVIESGDPYQMAWKALASGRGLRIPVVAFYHSHFPEAYLRSTMRYFGALATEMAMDIAKNYVHALYSRFARTFVPSEALAAVLRGWNVDNVVTMELGVNTAVFHPGPDDAADTRLRLELPADRTLLLYVGRLAREKNTQTLFAAFETLAARAPGRFHLLVVGDGTQRDLLKSLRRRVDGVSWRPYCSDSEELSRIYRAADLFVHPGLLETFGLVSIESQACGTPVVGIRGSYMDRIIFSDQAFWATEDTPDALADAILSVASQDPRAAGAAAARCAADRYSWNSVFEKLFRVYEEVATV